MCLLDYTFYMDWKQFEMVRLGLALKLGLHPVAIAHLSPGTHRIENNFYNLETTGILSGTKGQEIQAPSPSRPGKSTLS
jgi:hypothetical protein